MISRLILQGSVWWTGRIWNGVMVSQPIRSWHKILHYLRDFKDYFRDYFGDYFEDYFKDNFRDCFRDYFRDRYAPTTEHTIDCLDGRAWGGADLPSTTGMDKHPGVDLPLTGGMGVHPGTDLPLNAGIGVHPVVKLPSAGEMGRLTIDCWYGMHPGQTYHRPVGLACTR